MHKLCRSWSLAILALSFESHPLHADPSRTNVVLILMDDLGWADLGCYGSRFHRTPHLDQLAKDGMRFTQAYAACPVCSPTRASIMTGKYPARLHLTDFLPGRGDRPAHRMLRPAFLQQLPREEITLPKVLKSAGYVSASIGKWHLGGHGFGPIEQGFDENIAGDETGTPLSYFAPFRRADRVMPGLEHAPDGEYLTDRLTTEAEKFIERHRDQPFFLYLAHYAVHIPLRAKADLVAKYPSAGRAPGAQCNPIYAAMIESMDESVGRILRKLQALGLDDNTVVMFTSDNGGLATLEGPNTPPTINKPLREGKGYLYEGGIRVPLMVKWPKHVPAGSLCESPVCSIDLFPTILDLAGAKWNHSIDGRRLTPLLHQTGTLDREALYWHYPHYSNQGGHPGGVVRSGNYKLIEFYDTGRRELFDLKADVPENNNLAASMPDRTKVLAAKLDDWRRSVGAQLMKPNPDYHPNPQSPDGTIILHARTAEVHGSQVRFEPLPHKDTLGFWTRAEDWASWEFELKKPGIFQVQAMLGCSKGSAGSDVAFAIGDQSCEITVPDTGGFHSFATQDIGVIELAKPGRYTLTVKPLYKTGAAVMDLRQVILLPKT